MQPKILKEERHHGTQFFPVAVYEEHQTPEIMIVDYHWHDEWEFLWLLDGRGKFQIDGHREILEKGQIMLVPPCAIHGGIPLPKQNCSFRALVFHPRILGETATDLLQAKFIEPFLSRHSHFPDFLPADTTLSAELRTIFEQIFSACRQQQKPLGYELMVKSLLLAAWSKLLASGLADSSGILPREKRHQENMREVLYYIHEHQNEKITNQELADLLNVSESYFCRFFKRSMQMTPTEYIQRCRIKEAALKLQREQNLPIIEIAFDCGFNNLSYFNLVFKKLMACTPTEYKERIEKDTVPDRTNI